MKKKNLGQGMTEYLIIVALIAVSAIGIVRITSSSLMIGYGKIANALQGEKRSEGSYEKVNSSDVKGRTLKDFNQGVIPGSN